MGLEGHRATQRWVVLGTVCISHIKILKQDVRICTLHVHWFMHDSNDHNMLSEVHLRIQEEPL